MTLPNDVIQKFEKVTRFPLSEYFERYLLFLNQHRLDIIKYYAGELSRPNERSFAALRSLLRESRDLADLVDIHSNRMREGIYWELIEVLTNMNTLLETIDNSSKWLRSAITKNNFNPNMEQLLTLKRLQTIERLVGEELGSVDRELDWVQLALRNSLEEEDYTPEGGVELLASGRGRLTIQLRSVVDNIDGEKVYGKDLDRTLQFVDDDLKVLSYKETIKQAVRILAEMVHGKSPEFPGNGIQLNLTRGVNINSINYPILIRQMYQTFNQDDTLKTLMITDMKVDQDAVFISFEVETRMGEIIEQSVTL